MRTPAFLAGVITGAVLTAAIIAVSPAPAAQSSSPSGLPTPAQLAMIDALVPCISEDSIGCYWDASARGNGTGQDFVSPHPQIIDAHSITIEGN